MSKLKIQIQESVESKEARKSEQFDSAVLKSLDFPIVDSEGYCTGVFSGFEPISPTGEVKTSRNGNIWTDKRAQIKFSFTVPTENCDYMTLNFWTGTCIDGVKDEKGRYSKITTWLVAIGALDAKTLHAKYKADEKSIMNVISQLFEQKFKFKTEMKGRIHVPIIETFELIEEDTEEDSE